jgi:hypothetical protein
MKTTSLIVLFTSAMANVGCSQSGPRNCTDNPRTAPLLTFVDEAGADAGVDCIGSCRVNGPSTGFCSANSDGKTVTCHTDCTGRRPAGFEARGDVPSTLGEYFAELARLEAASIDAFGILAGDLVRLGAPGKLVKSALRARRDEIRHARAMSELARRFGCEPTATHTTLPAPRSLVDVAIENAVEGCVRETFGALVAHWQAHHAKDLGIRSAMARIARDETKHAALAWQIDAWIRSKLTREEDDRVTRAMEDAAGSLRMAGEPPAELADRAGMPASLVSADLAAQLYAALWSKAA